MTAQHVDAHLVGFDTLVGFRLHAIVGFFNSVQRLLFVGPIASADGFRALKGHVLEHMNQTGLSGGVLNAADIHPGVKRNHGRLVTFQYNETQPVGEGKFAYLLLQFLHILRGQGKARGEKQGAEIQTTHD